MAAGKPTTQSPTSAGESADEIKSPSLGISILKEIFPNHGSGEGLPPAKQMMLNSIPTPSRASSSPTHALTSTSPVRAFTSTTPLASPSLPPVPVMPSTVPSCPPPPVMAPCPPPPGSSMYRERLRAGGREALQRAFNVGLMPKSMKQEAMYSNDMQGARQDAAMSAHSLPQHNTPVSSPMAYASVAEGHTMWDATAPMHSTDYWPSQMEHPSMLEQSQMMAHYAGSHDMQQMMPQFQQGWSPVTMQQPELQSHGQLPTGASIPMPHMQVPQMHMQQLEGRPVLDSSPTELHRCMAIIMPEAAQFPCDKNMMAAQLQAAADCQCYED